MKLIPRLHPSTEPLLHNNLAKAWSEAYINSRKPLCLDHAIQAAHKSVSCSASNDPSQVSFRRNYLIYLKKRFELTKNIADLEEMERVKSGLEDKFNTQKHSTVPEGECEGTKDRRSLIPHSNLAIKVWNSWQ